MLYQTDMGAVVFVGYIYARVFVGSGCGCW